MRTVSTLTILFLAACTVAPPPEPAPMSTPSTSWTTELQANSGFQGARGSAEVRSNAGGTAVAVGFGEVPGMTGTVRPWHVHRGRCGNDLGIVGDPNAYQALRPGATGVATSNAVVTVPLTPGSEYFVNIHRSPTELQTIVACGQLRQTM